MGCANTKNLHSRASSTKYSNFDLEKGFVKASTKKTDENIIKIMHREFKDTPEVFILNNILMSVLFFENYRKEFSHLYKLTTTKMERELNPTLLKNEKASCITPDVLADSVNKNIRFRPFHGPKKEISEPLVTKRIYVVNDTIDVITEEEEGREYNSIDKPGYQVALEESNHKGYIKLRQITNISCPSSEIPSTPIRKIEPTAGPSSLPDGQIYEYNTINNIQTPKPLEKPLEIAQRRDTLPKSCFAFFKQPKYISDDISATNIEDLYELVAYITSKGFMKYFLNQKFPHSLGSAMGFDKLHIDEAKYIPGKIFCNLLDDDDYILTTEIIPCVEIPWPKQANSFKNRETRPTVTVTNPHNGISTRCKWPTDKMVEDIMSLKCAAVPKGFFPKKGTNPESEIEWEIHFPKAEKYLETHMTYEQHCIYLFLLAIHKTYIEPFSAQHGILADHIRCHIFWECEQNYLNWPQHRLGTKIIKVIENFNEKLSKYELYDYFIQQKNVLENIPRKYIIFAHEVFFKILETPAMSFIKAVRNLRYTSGKFYPTLNFKELYENLVKDGIKATHSIPTIQAAPQNGFVVQKKNVDKEALWHLQKLQLARKKYIEQKNKEKENLKVEETRRGSEDSINIKWNYKEADADDHAKTRLLLRQFINVYFQILKRSRQIASKKQAQFYCKQCDYLINMLENEASTFEEQVREFKEMLENEKFELEAMEEEKSNGPPSTPARNSMQIFNFDFKQQVKGNIVNKRKLNISYNKGFQ